MDQATLTGGVIKKKPEPKIKFIDGAHRYFDEDTGKELISATTFIKKFFAPFDKYAVSEICSQKDGIPAEIIRAQWENETHVGTLTHSYAECKIKKITPPVPTTPDVIGLFHAVDGFLQNEKVNYLFTEKIVGSPRLGVAGTIDVGLIINGMLYIGDWKTNKNIQMFGYNNKCALHPISHLQDCNYIQYTLQMSLYKYILEEEYGHTVYGLRLIHLKRDGTYHIYQPEELRTDITKMLRHSKLL
jgi:hypothetical protein